MASSHLHDLSRPSPARFIDTQGSLEQGQSVALSYRPHLMLMMPVSGTTGHSTAIERSAIERPTIDNGASKDIVMSEYEAVIRERLFTKDGPIHGPHRGKDPPTDKSNDKNGSQRLLLCFRYREPFEKNGGAIKWTQGKVTQLNSRAAFQLMRSHAVSHFYWIWRCSAVVKGRAVAVGTFDVGPGDEEVLNDTIKVGDIPQSHRRPHYLCTNTNRTSGDVEPFDDKELLRFFNNPKRAGKDRQALDKLPRMTSPPKEYVPSAAANGRSWVSNQAWGLIIEWEVNVAATQLYLLSRGIMVIVPAVCLAFVLFWHVQNILGWLVSLLVAVTVFVDGVLITMARDM